MRLALAAAFSIALAAPAPAAVQIQDVTSPQGLRAWLVEDRSIPIVALEVIFPGGAVLDPADAQGATALMAALLEEGAGDLDAQGFAAALEDTAGSVTFDAGRDQVTVSIRALTENLDQVVDLARLALLQPRFDAVAVDRVRAQMRSSLERDQRDPDTLASQGFAARAFDGHPYARPADGTLGSVDALTIDHIRAAHRGAFTRARVLVGAAGDIGATDLGRVMDRLLADLPADAPPLPAYAAFAATPGVTVIDHPAPQSVIAFGHGGMRRDDPDFTAAFVLNEIFGGGRFGTRLMVEVRERRGLTYGIGTAVSAGAHGDSFQGRFSTDNSRAAEAIDLIRAEWAWLAGGGITQSDLDRAITYLTGAYPLRFDGNAEIAQIMASMQFQGFGIDYVNVRNDLIRAVTLADVTRVASRLARPDELVFVVVGRPEGVTPTP